MSWFREILRPELAQLRAYHPSSPPAGAVRLDANESPHPLSTAARQRISDELARIDLHRYPDGRATRLRECIAERTGAHPDEIIVGCGSDEVIAVLISALSGRRAGHARAATLFPDPSFVMFRMSSLAAGAEPISVPLDAGWDLDVELFRTAIATHAPGIVFLPSPNNPTGNLFGDDRIDAVIEAARDRALVLLDEAYGRFSGRTYSSLRSRHEHVGQLQTLSKIGLAGARVGWAILPRELAIEVDKVRQPYNLNTLSQRLGVLAMTELAGEFDAAVQLVLGERDRLAVALASQPGVRVEPSASNFLWVDVGRDASEVHRALASRGVLVRSFHASGGRLERYLRITVGTAAENARLLDAWRAMV